MGFIPNLQKQQSIESIRERNNIPYCQIVLDRIHSLYQDMKPYSLVNYLYNYIIIVIIIFFHSFITTINQQFYSFISININHFIINFNSSLYNLKKFINSLNLFDYFHSHFKLLILYFCITTDLIILQKLLQILRNLYFMTSL